MALHGDMRVEVVKGAIGLATVGPDAHVHALNLVVAATRTLLDGVPGQSDERVRLSICVARRPVGAGVFMCGWASVCKTTAEVGSNTA